MNIQFSYNVLRDIEAYCKANGIAEVDKFASKCLSTGFNIVRFGTSPMDNMNRENNGIKELEKYEEGSKKSNVGRRKKKEQEEQGTEEVIQVPAEEEKPKKRIRIIKKDSK